MKAVNFADNTVLTDLWWIYYSLELRLAIEIDGDSHYQDGVPEYDRDRQAFLSSKGTRILRFTNQEVYQDIDGVVDKIR
ncbi:MAG: DUF559 domain-containing protein [Nostoc sp.]|uniref:endonuclease domain-containing protein n=1 Tax=Nostoc sp. TaxID=1180 RepID=UPI002FF8D13B